MTLKAHAGHIADKLEESEMAEKSAVVARHDAHEAADESIYVRQRSGFASNLIKMVNIPEAEYQIITLMETSQQDIDFCRNTHFLCRLAKKLGCQFCAKK